MAGSEPGSHTAMALFEHGVGGLAHEHREVGARRHAGRQAGRQARGRQAGGRQAGGRQADAIFCALVGCVGGGSSSAAAKLVRVAMVVAGDTMTIRTAAPTTVAADVDRPHRPDLQAARHSLSQHPTLAVCRTLGWDGGFEGTKRLGVSGRQAMASGSTASL